MSNTEDKTSSSINNENASSAAETWSSWLNTYTGAATSTGTTVPTSVTTEANPIPGKQNQIQSQRQSSQSQAKKSQSSRSQQSSTTGQQQVQQGANKTQNSRIQQQGSSTQTKSINPSNTVTKAQQTVQQSSQNETKTQQSSSDPAPDDPSQTSTAAWLSSYVWGTSTSEEQQQTQQNDNQTGQVSNPNTVNLNKVTTNSNQKNQNKQQQVQYGTGTAPTKTLMNLTTATVPRDSRSSIESGESTKQQQIEQNLPNSKATAQSQGQSQPQGQPAESQSQSQQNQPQQKTLSQNNSTIMSSSSSSSSLESQYQYATRQLSGPGPGQQNQQQQPGSKAQESQSKKIKVPIGILSQSQQLQIQNENRLGGALGPVSGFNFQTQQSLTNTMSQQQSLSRLSFLIKQYTCLTCNGTGKGEGGVGARLGDIGQAIRESDEYKTQGNDDDTKSTGPLSSLNENHNDSDQLQVKLASSQNQDHGAVPNSGYCVSCNGSGAISSHLVRYRQSAQRVLEELSHSESGTNQNQVSESRMSPYTNADQETDSMIKFNDIDTIFDDPRFLTLAGEIIRCPRCNSTGEFNIKSISNTLNATGESQYPEGGPTISSTQLQDSSCPGCAGKKFIQPLMHVNNDGSVILDSLCICPKCKGKGRYRKPKIKIGSMNFGLNNTSYSNIDKGTINDEKNESSSLINQNTTSISNAVKSQQTLTNQIAILQKLVLRQQTQKSMSQQQQVQQSLSSAQTGPPQSQSKKDILNHDREAGSDDDDDEDDQGNGNSNRGTVSKGSGTGTASKSTKSKKEKKTKSSDKDKDSKDIANKSKDKKQQDKPDSNINVVNKNPVTSLELVKHLRTNLIKSFQEVNTKLKNNLNSGTVTQQQLADLKKIRDVLYGNSNTITVNEKIQQYPEFNPSSRTGTINVGNSILSTTEFQKYEDQKQIDNLNRMLQSFSSNNIQSDSDLSSNTNSSQQQSQISDTSYSYNLPISYTMQDQCETCQDRGWIVHARIHLTNIMEPRLPGLTWQAQSGLFADSEFLSTNGGPNSNGINNSQSQSQQQYSQGLGGISSDENSEVTNTVTQQQGSVLSGLNGMKNMRKSSEATSATDTGKKKQLSNNSYSVTQSQSQTQSQTVVQGNNNINAAAFNSNQQVQQVQPIKVNFLKRVFACEVCQGHGYTSILETYSKSEAIKNMLGSQQDKNKLLDIVQDYHNRVQMNLVSNQDGNNGQQSHSQQQSQNKAGKISSGTGNTDSNLVLISSKTQQSQLQTTSKISQSMQKSQQQSQKVTSAATISQQGTKQPQQSATVTQTVKSTTTDKGPLKEGQHKTENIIKSNKATKPKATIASDCVDESSMTVEYPSSISEIFGYISDKIEDMGNSMSISETVADQNDQSIASVASVTSSRNPSQSLVNLTTVNVTDVTVANTDSSQSESDTDLNHNCNPNDPNESSDMLTDASGRSLSLIRTVNEYYQNQQLQSLTKTSSKTKDADGKLIDPQTPESPLSSDYDGDSTDSEYYSTTVTQTNQQQLYPKNQNLNTPISTVTPTAPFLFMPEEIEDVDTNGTKPEPISSPKSPQSPGPSPGPTGSSLSPTTSQKRLSSMSVTEKKFGAAPTVVQNSTDSNKKISSSSSNLSNPGSPNQIATGSPTSMKGTTKVSVTNSSSNIKNNIPLEKIVSSANNDLNLNFLKYGPPPLTLTKSEVESYGIKADSSDFFDLYKVRVLPCLNCRCKGIVAVEF